MNFNNEVDNSMTLISRQPYPETIPPQQTEVKSRRRKRKSRAETSGGMKKRKLNPEQVNFLEQNFGNEHKLESDRKDRLAFELGLDPRQVAVWFQNRRARYKYKKMEEEYSQLKTIHESLMQEKSHLETQILNLKKQLSEAEEKIQGLSLERANGLSSYSPIRSSDPMDARFPWDFGFQGIDENALYMQEIHYNLIHGLEWFNLYI